MHAHAHTHTHQVNIVNYHGRTALQEMERHKPKEFERFTRWQQQQAQRDAQVCGTGDCVVLAFMRPKSMPRQTGSRLIQKLIGFERITDLGPGLDVRVTFAVNAETMAIADLKTGDLVQTPGSFEIAFADGSGDEVVAEIKVIGKQYVVEEFPRVH